jgi:hypothetical protein
MNQLQNGKPILIEFDIEEFREKLKMAVVWVVAPCNLVDVYRRFRGVCCVHYQGDKHL